MTQKENEQEFADILFLLVTVQCFVPLELGPDVGQLFVDSLNFGLFALTISDVGYKDGQSSHPIAANGRHFDPSHRHFDGLDESVPQLPAEEEVRARQFHPPNFGLKVL